MHGSRATGPWTDVPVRTCDFQAPLGEAGALYESAYALKNLHMLTADWGESLTGSVCYYPTDQVTDAENTTTLRWCVRWNADNEKGFLFINKHQRGAKWPTTALWNSPSTRGTRPSPCRRWTFLAVSAE